MINELYQASKALENANIEADTWHREYNPIPNIRANAPCIKITLHEGTVTELSAVSEELGAFLRKYGNYQRSYPCLNLASLYRISDGERKKFLAKLKPEQIDDEKLKELHSWCTEENNNWCKKFQNKYRLSIVKTSKKLSEFVENYEPLEVLRGESDYFADPALLHSKLEKCVWAMLKNKENVSLALSILFYAGKDDQSSEDDYGSLSVALESQKLVDAGTPAVSRKFVKELNARLLAGSKIQTAAGIETVEDAFGVSFSPLKEPMPSVKLAGGLTPILRTMSKDQLSQFRYGKIGHDSYPISLTIRTKLQAALNWLGSAEQKDKTWINTDRNEILFAYPDCLPQKNASFTSLFHRKQGNKSTFQAQAKAFLKELREGRDPDTDSHAERISIFILRKIEKGRTKMIYTRQTDAFELEQCCERWHKGCKENLPEFRFENQVPFPLDAADILNRFWKQSGELATDKFRPIPKYHGVELLMEPERYVVSDLHRLTEQAMTIGSYLGALSAKGRLDETVWEKKVNGLTALLGFMLYQKGIRKEIYMENLPYLYGQLLKATDDLHLLYCNVMRKGEVPPQLAGGALFQAAVDAPIRTLNVLGQRIMPYYTWAKSYRHKNKEEKGKESWRAGWLVSVFERTSTMLYSNWTQATRFNDAEKAQMFLGYLAAFPKKETDRTLNADGDKEENRNEK